MPLARTCPVPTPQGGSGLANRPADFARRATHRPGLLEPCSAHPRPPLRGYLRAIEGAKPNEQSIAPKRELESIGRKLALQKGLRRSEGGALGRNGRHDGPRFGSTSGFAGPWGAPSEAPKGAIKGYLRRPSAPADVKRYCSVIGGAVGNAENPECAVGCSPAGTYPPFLSPSASTTSRPAGSSLFGPPRSPVEGVLGRVWEQKRKPTRQATPTTRRPGTHRTSTPARGGRVPSHGRAREDDGGR